ncbi:MAG: antitoxin [Rubrobacteraceae bacterium]
MKRVGEAVVLLPREDSWRTLYESLGSFSEDFMEERGQPPTSGDAREPMFG